MYGVANRAGQNAGSESFEKNALPGTAVTVQGSIGFAPGAWVVVMAALIGKAPQPPEVNSCVWNPPLPQWSAAFARTW